MKVIKNECNRTDWDWNKRVNILELGYESNRDGLGQTKK